MAGCLRIKSSFYKLNQKYGWFLRIKVFINTKINRERQRERKINMFHIITIPESSLILKSIPDSESPCSWLSHSLIRFKNRQKLDSGIHFQKWQCIIENMQKI